MKRQRLWLGVVAVALALLMLTEPVWAQRGGRGRGGGGGGRPSVGARSGGGGGAARSFGGARSMSRGAMGGRMQSAPRMRSAAPRMSRPSVSRPSVSRPSVSRPSVSRPNISSRVQQAPSIRSMPRSQPTQRLQTARPQVTRPQGQVTRPQVTRPQVTRPQTNRPSVVDRSQLDRSRATRPELGSRGTTTLRPDFDRRNRGTAQRSMERGQSALDRARAAERARTPGLADRVRTPDRVGTPDRAGDRRDLADRLQDRTPGRATGPQQRDGRTGDRSRFADRDFDRTRDMFDRARRDADRITGRAPGRDGRGERVGPGAGDRMADRRAQLDRFLDRDGAVRGRDGRPGGRSDAADLRERARRIAERPEWTRNVRGNPREVRDNLARAIGGRDFARDGRRGDWDGRRDGDRRRWDGDRDWHRHDWGRYSHSHRWRHWADPVHHWWHHHHHGIRWFTPRWWAANYVYRPWSYLNYYGWGWGGVGYRPWSYWWSTPTWVSVNTWFAPTWGYTDYVWYEPVYYDYGPGGNVIYQSDGVYVNDVYVGTPDVYAASAAELATIDPAQIESQERGEWLALGTFALVIDRQATEPKHVVQLAVDRQGIVSGTMFNRETGESFAVTGRVDPETQRVAFRIDDQPDVVYETGIYNLTQDQTPVLVHEGTDSTETHLLVRLQQPDAEAPDVDTVTEPAETAPEGSRAY